MVRFCQRAFILTDAFEKVDVALIFFVMCLEKK